MRKRRICHLFHKEIPENAADIAHLDYLHGPIFLAGTNLKEMRGGKWDCMQHRWDASWAPCEDPSEKHCSLLNIKAHVQILGRLMPFFAFDFKAKQVLCTVVL